MSFCRELIPCFFVLSLTDIFSIETCNQVIGSAATLKSNPLGKNIVESAEKRNPLFKVKHCLSCCVEVGTYLHSSIVLLHFCVDRYRSQWTISWARRIWRRWMWLRTWRFLMLQGMNSSCCKLWHYKKRWILWLIFVSK